MEKPAAYECRLGEKAYWDEHYSLELQNYQEHEDEGMDWFSENIGSRLLDWLCNENNAIGARPDELFDVLDLGCGNGAWLFDIEIERTWKGRLFGIDNSEVGITLAKNLATSRNSQVEFAVADISSLNTSASDTKFHCVHDKGTYDAFMLHPNNCAKTYAHAVLRSLHPQGRLILTSCNHTADELVRDLTKASDDRLRHLDTLRYPTFRFGGKEGAAVSTVSFELLVD